MPRSVGVRRCGHGDTAVRGTGTRRYGARGHSRRHGGTGHTDTGRRPGGGSSCCQGHGSRLRKPLSSLQTLFGSRAKALLKRWM